MLFRPRPRPISSITTEEMFLFKLLCLYLYGLCTLLYRGVYPSRGVYSRGLLFRVNASCSTSYYIVNCIGALNVLNHPQQKVKMTTPLGMYAALYKTQCCMLHILVLFYVTFHFIHIITDINRAFNGNCKSNSK